ncbi:hypothetical protein PSEUBRA_002351 [Kalmanozyma brasiliensis GHG001]|uniref:Conserved oligomeric Golgi complex subunit 2 n=1 Tax=Kalmanozyma brasiliensis (strain GHG001) TaxID=1365824 RepID=V5GPT2_KALBG|nr:uncharacterized protein PSEUBRA_002351 [Kalmanozyma brasiliensis GHG001]EST07967.1 hypothetical protein PSEUBRA_002351 [Kalmanozyma brasiliensis GHG001]
MAAATSDSHHASSSLNGDAAPFSYDDPQGSHAFPSLAPLSHDLELLSPAKVSDFSVDDFLLSRTKASDLNFILSDLRSYSEKLKDELYSIINEDYKDFVSLGSSLKAEAHRIARLGWNVRSIDAGAHSHVPPEGLLAPVRDTLLASRSMLKSVQDDIEGCIKRKEDATSQKARLELMLQLHDSITRLEDLLLIQTDKTQKGRTRSLHATRRPSTLGVTPLRERRQSIMSTTSDSEQDLSDYAMSSGYEDGLETEDNISSDEPTTSKANGDGQPRRARRRILRRFSSSAQNARSPIQQRTSSDAAASSSRAPSDTLKAAGAGSSSLLGLPQRIARTSAEYSRLRFLHRRIDEEDLTHAADALRDRIETVRSVLRQDLRKLLGALVSPNSLLVHGQSNTKAPASPEMRRSMRPSPSAARRTSFLQGHSIQAESVRELSVSELEAWSQVAEPIEGGSAVEEGYWEARLEEQRSWLEMALTTLNTLTLVQNSSVSEDTQAKLRNEAEEAVRDLLVSAWAAKAIVNDKQLTDDDMSATLEKLPPAVQAQFDEHHNKLQSLLLPTSTSSPLVETYNAILSFVASTAWHVCDASREISDQTRSAAATEALDTAERARDARCDVFTNVVWDELSSRLLDTMGSTIFFVGQTDTFYSNFTLTNDFLQRFLSLAPTDAAKLAMQEHPNWLVFKRRWQLPVYFQMRFREVVLQLESQLVDGRSAHETAQGKCMLATHATLQAISKLWSEGVHIHELSAREWRVTLQLLSRYKTWVEEQSPAELTTVNGAANRPLDVVRTSSAAGASDGSRNSNDISRVSTPQPPPDLTSQQHDDETLHFATALLADCFFLQTQMGVLLDSTIFARIAAHMNLDNASGLDELRVDLQRVLETESLDFIPGLSASVGRLAYSIILPRATSPLRLLRSFSTPAYRSTSTPAAGEGGPSVQVIHQILAPLSKFLSTETPGLPPTIVREWIKTILGDILKRYTSTIETVNKNQQSLIRLKKSQNPGLLGGLFKSTANPGGAAEAGELERQFAETNRLALKTWREALDGLGLELQLDEWEAWVGLRSFLESELDAL